MRYLWILQRICKPDNTYPYLEGNQELPNVPRHVGTTQDTRKPTNKYLLILNWTNVDCVRDLMIESNHHPLWEIVVSNYTETQLRCDEPYIIRQEWLLLCAEGHRGENP